MPSLDTVKSELAILLARREELAERAYQLRKQFKLPVGELCAVAAEQSYIEKCIAERTMVPMRTAYYENKIKTNQEQADPDCFPPRPERKYADMRHRNNQRL